MLQATVLSLCVFTDDHNINIFVSSFHSRDALTVNHIGKQIQFNSEMIQPIINALSQNQWLALTSKRHWEKVGQFHPPLFAKLLFDEYNKRYKSEDLLQVSTFEAHSIPLDGGDGFFDGTFVWY